MAGKKRIKALDYEKQFTVIPRLWTLRRVPGRYRRLLPVAIMKRYQCVVVGRERGILTIAIAEPESMCILNMLSTLTGYTIFPVLVDPVRMRLLIRRMERMERIGCTSAAYLTRYYALQQRSTLLFLISRYHASFEK